MGKFLKLSDLSSLEKETSVGIHECNILAQRTSQGEIISTVGEKDGRFFLFGENERREIALEWDISEHKKRFYYTHDDLHIVSIDIDTETKQIMPAEVQQMDTELLQPGMKCEYNGLAVTYMGEKSLLFETENLRKEIKIASSDEFIMQVKKTQINAINGSKGLFCFLEQVAEQKKIEPSNVIFGSCFSGLKEKLPIIKELSKKKSEVERE